MTTVAIVYHSGFGHTKLQAEAVRDGAAQVEGVEALLLTSDTRVPTLIAPHHDRRKLRLAAGGGEDLGNEPSIHHSTARLPTYHDEGPQPTTGRGLSFAGSGRSCQVSYIKTL